MTAPNALPKVIYRLCNEGGTAFAKLRNVPWVYAKFFSRKFFLEKQLEGQSQHHAASQNLTPLKVNAAAILKFLSEGQPLTESRQIG